jgi:acetyltransferase-like isoleucine patch superfamily enzyme
MAAARTLSWDWYPGTIPENVLVDETAYLESTFSFHLYRSTLPTGVRMGHGASAYMGTMFDVGPRGQVSIGKYTLVHGAWIICDEAVEIGDYTLISWNVVLMDTLRLPVNPAARRRELKAIPNRCPRRIEADIPARPVRIGGNVWIGFDTCVMPGVTIGTGAVVGARSVVIEDVPPFTIVAGNPARVLRRLDMEAGQHAPGHTPQGEDSGFWHPLLVPAGRRDVPISALPAGAAPARV